MHFTNKRRPSPALIVAAIALVFAMVGTSVAQDPVGKVTGKKVRKFANQEIDKRAANLSVLKAKSADTATTATNAVNATNATNAVNAQKAVIGAPEAYAGINADASLTTGYAAKGITTADVTTPTTGIYCIVLAFTPTTAAANAQAAATEDGILSVDLVPPFNASCPAATKAEVRNVDAGSDALQADSFLVQFDG